jgi:hypothetical protein
MLKYLNQYLKIVLKELNTSLYLVAPVGALMFVSVCTDTLRGCLIVVLQSV